MSNQRSIPFGYLLRLLGQGHEDPLLFSGGCSGFARDVKDQEAVNQESS